LKRIRCSTTENEGVYVYSRVAVIVNDGVNVYTKMNKRVNVNSRVTVEEK